MSPVVKATLGTMAVIALWLVLGFTVGWWPHLAIVGTAMVVLAVIEWVRVFRAERKRDGTATRISASDPPLG